MAERRPAALYSRMLHTPATAARPARLLVLLMGFIGVQPVPVGAAADPGAPSRAQPAAVLSGPAIPLPVSAVDSEPGNGDGRTDPDASMLHAGEPGRPAATSACAAVFCPWRAVNALARAGRRSSPSTAPPASPV